MLTWVRNRFTFRSNHFDVVHSQMVAGGIHANRWRSYIRDIFRVLKPGGWCQMVEIYFNAQSDNGTLGRGDSPSLLNTESPAS
jgi:SAM-dependent methyltransferase